MGKEETNVVKDPWKQKLIHFPYFNKSTKLGTDESKWIQSTV